MYIVLVRHDHPDWQAPKGEEPDNRSFLAIQAPNRITVATKKDGSPMMFYTQDEALEVVMNQYGMDRATVARVGTIEGAAMGFNLTFL